VTNTSDSMTLKSGRISLALSAHHHATISELSRSRFLGAGLTKRAAPPRRRRPRCSAGLTLRRSNEGGDSTIVTHSIGD
jgi:hypothetical protein